MPTIRVEIDWDNDDPHWLNADNVHMCLQSYCKNTKFEVREVGGVGDHLSASEALFGFAAWRTTRDEAITLSGHHDAGAAADVVGEFCERNNLIEPRRDWTDGLVYPESAELSDIKLEKISGVSGVRWWFYNLAYLLIGHTKWWATVGPRIWE